MLYWPMKNTTYTTPMLPGFNLRTLRQKPRSEQQKLAERIALLRQKSFKQIGEVFEKFIPRELLKPESSGVMSRRRLFSKENTFWAFFSQVLDADGGCMEVIRKLQSYASIKGIKVPSSSTASYCTARKKLDEQMLSDILIHTANRLEQMPETGMLNTAPAAGSFGYEAYNFLVTTLLKGPFGAISAILLFLVTILLFVQQKIVPAIVCLVAAIVLINAANMVTALGAIY